MFSLPRAIFLVLVTAVFTCSAQDSRDQANFLVLVFKDGHQKSLAVSEVSRIEFDPPKIVMILSLMLSLAFRSCSIGV